MKKNILTVIIIVIAFLVIGYFNGLVSESCFHGNCTHGWYSKYNKTEKAIATIGILSIIGISILLIIAVRADKSEVFSKRNYYHNLSDTEGFIRHEVSVSSKHVSPNEKIVQKAIENKSKISFDYTKPGRKKSQKRIIMPKKIQYVGHRYSGNESLCVYGYCELRKENRNFTIKRMASIIIITV